MNVSPQFTSIAAPEGVSPDVNGPLDHSCLASGRSAMAGVACKAPAPLGRPGGR